VDLEELLVDGQLHQDKWSLNTPTFGASGQIRVVGWSHTSSANHKCYVIYCSECAKDPELFAEGFFRTLKRSLLLGRLPCGCAPRVDWTEDQYKILMARSLESSSVKLLGWDGEYRRGKTRMLAVCEIHGEFKAGMTISNYREKGVYAGMCKECGLVKFSEHMSKSDDQFIETFMSTGAYVEGTKITYAGFKQYPTNSTKFKHWEVFCPTCNVTYISRSSTLQSGCLGCNCARSNQKQAYINKIYDASGIVCLKLGISFNAEKRRSQIQLATNYTVLLSDVFTFESATDCRKAEKICKETLLCAVMSKDEIPDGYSETTSIDNYDEIVKIYQDSGGKRLALSTKETYN
jgi:hypothetical protein